MWRARRPIYISAEGCGSHPIIPTGHIITKTSATALSSVCASEPQMIRGSLHKYAMTSDSPSGAALSSKLPYGTHTHDEKMVRATLGKKVKITSNAIGTNAKNLSHFEEVFLPDAKGVHFDERDGRIAGDASLELSPPCTSLIALGVKGEPGEPGEPGVPGSSAPDGGFRAGAGATSYRVALPESEPQSRDLRSGSATLCRILPIIVTTPKTIGRASMITSDRARSEHVISRCADRRAPGSNGTVIYRE